MVPVRQRGDEHALEVVEDALERLAAFGRAVGQRAAHLTGRDARQDRVPLGATQVLGDPFHQRVAVSPELRGVHYLCALM